MAYGLTLEGGVTYTVESARKEAFEGVKYKIPVSSFKEHLRDRNFAENGVGSTGVKDLGDKWVEHYSDGSYGIVYKKNLFYSFFYNKSGNLTEIEIRTSLVCPTKTYKYMPNGRLENVIFVVSKNESFIYRLNGELEAHWIGNNCYDENGKLVLTRF